MRQPDHEYEERSFGDIQRAIDFENSMNDLESQLYYQHLSPKEVAQQVLKARRRTTLEPMNAYLPILRC